MQDVLRRGAPAGAIVLLLLWIAVPEATRVQDERFEFSCVAFPDGLRETDLIARYGVQNVVRAGVTATDDAPVPGTRLFPDQDEWIDIAWRQAEERREPAWIRVRPRDGNTASLRGRWRTPQGVGLGDDLLGLERRNGWPFRLGGFAFEGGQGALRSWGRGRLAAMDAGQCTFTITFQPQQSWDRRLGRLTHGEFSSGHPAMQASNPLVVALWIHYRNR